MSAKAVVRLFGLAFIVASFAGIAAESKDRETPSSANQNQKKGTQQATPPGHPAVILLVPAELYARNEALANGCWVRLYESKNFRGNQLAVFGPADLPDVEDNTPVWGFDSAIVGPKATVTTYDEEDYQDRNATLSPGQRVADLGDKKLGFFQDIESLKVSCS